MYAQIKKGVCSNKYACLLALGTTNPCLLCLHMKICPHTRIYIYGKFQDHLHIWYSIFVTTTLCTGPSCLVFRFHPVISLSSFFPMFLSNCLLSLSLLSFFPLDFVQFFKVTLLFLFVSSLSLLFYSYAITLLPQQNFNIYYPSLLFTYCVWCCAWCNRRRGP